MAGGGGGTSWAERHKPWVAMVLVQLFYSFVDMALKTAYGLGMRPIVFVAYRQGIAAITLLLASLDTRGCTLRPMAVGARAFTLLFVASLASAIGQYFYFMGLQLASLSMARATTNLAPGITFAIAAVIGLEKVDLSLRSAAKIIGTIICLAGAMIMAFFKGPKLIGALLLPAIDDWVRGGMYLMGNAFCFSIWYILQVPVCKSYLDPLSLATWMCFLATLQCAVMAFFLEANYIQIWKLASIWEFPCILYGGVFASGANFFLQSWCISVKGPLYSAIFTPVSAVITTILSTLFLGEELHIGSILGAIAIIIGLYVVLWGKVGLAVLALSILGAIAIIIGLYVVLWGKAEDTKGERLAIHPNDSERIVDSDCIGLKVENETNLSEPLLSECVNGGTSSYQ